MWSGRARPTCLVPTLAVAATLLGARPAAAQRTGFALDRYEPAERGSAFFAAESLDFTFTASRGLAPAAGATFDFAEKPLVVYAPDGNVSGAIVRHQLFAHLGGDVVVGQRFRLGVALPVALFQDGTSQLVDQERYKPGDKPAIGDVRLGGAVRLVGAEAGPFRLGGRLRIWLPTGQRSEFTSDGSARFEPSVLAAGDAGRFAWAATLGFLVRTRNDDYAEAPLGSEVTLTAAGGVRFLKGRLLVGPEVLASTVVTDTRGQFGTATTPIEALLGAHHAIGVLRAGAAFGVGLSHGDGTPAFRALLSLDYAPAPPAPSPALAPALPPARPPPPPRPDTDGDGIPDDQDACPDTPGPATGDLGAHGCPPVAPSD